MARFSHLTVCNLLMVVSGFVRYEPPETNFFLLNGTDDQFVYYTNSSSTVRERLCLFESESKGVLLESLNTRFLSHKVCTDMKKPTYSNITLYHESEYKYHKKYHTSKVDCVQDEFYDITCNRTEVVGRCSFIKVDCGPCQQDIVLEANSKVELRSPLYPVLQPNLVCQYDLHFPPNVKKGISLEITELSLPKDIHSMSGDLCVSSFLLVLGGDTLNKLESRATLCGEIAYPKGRSLLTVEDNVVRLMLVSGSDHLTHGKKGFIINVNALELKDSHELLLIFLFVISILVFIGVVVACFLMFTCHWKSREKRVPMRRQTWHGETATTAVHMPSGDNQTGRINIRNWGARNLYMLDRPRKLPELPNFNFSYENQRIENEEDPDPGFKVYETLSINSTSSVKYASVSDHPYSKISSSTVSDIQPPPLPERPGTTDECPNFSPTYLPLSKVVTYENSERRDNSLQIDNEVCNSDEVEIASRETIVQTQECIIGVENNPRSGLSVIINRIRSISTAELEEDESNLLEETIEEGKS